MKEKPILFSGPMVRAILDGRKTQTRRILKPSPISRPFQVQGEATGNWFTENPEYPKRGAMFAQRFKLLLPGDRLWVRETWSHTGTGVWSVADARRAMNGRFVYRADGDTGTGGWFPSIHMPREASRITLRVTDVRVQRLQDISEEDAIAEGIQSTGGGRYWIAEFDDGYSPRGSPSMAFMDLWDRINGEASREANPFVYALTFEVEKAQNSSAGLKRPKADERPLPAEGAA